MPRQFRQITAKTVERRRFRFTPFGGRRFASRAADSFTSTPFRAFATFESIAKQVQHFFADLFEFQSQVHQNLRRYPFLFSQQTQQDVFRSNKIMVQVPRFFHRIFDYFFSSRGLRKLSHGDHFGTTLNEFFNFQTDLSQVYIEVF